MTATAVAASSAAIITSPALLSSRWVNTSEPVPLLLLEADADVVGGCDRGREDGADGWPPPAGGRPPPLFGAGGGGAAPVVRGCVAGVDW
jgi:hypothetical protein